jgi:hypothetical protein
MTDFQRFFDLWIISFAILMLLAALVALVVVISDRVIVFVLRVFRVRRIYQTAMQIAALIETDQRMAMRPLPDLPGHTQSNWHNILAGPPHRRDATGHMGTRPDRAADHTQCAGPHDNGEGA